MIGIVLSLSNTPEQFDPCDRRQHDIENDGIVDAAGGGGDSLPAVKVNRDLEALVFEILAQHRAQLDIVVDQQDVRARAVGAHLPDFAAPVPVRHLAFPNLYKKLPVS